MLSHYFARCLRLVGILLQINITLEEEFETNHTPISFFKIIYITFNFRFICPHHYCYQFSVNFGYLHSLSSNLSSSLSRTSFWISGILLLMSLNLLSFAFYATSNNSHSYIFLNKTLRLNLLQFSHSILRCLIYNFILFFYKLFFFTSLTLSINFIFVILIN